MQGTEFHPVAEMLRDINQDGIIINLQLTEQCNFACDHCFYAASPRSPKGYMSSDVLAQVHDFIYCCLDDLLAPSVTVNFIGGEPTLNLKEFKRCFREAMNWCWTHGHRLDWEMTTNGWWLNDDKRTLEFMEIIKDDIPRDGTVEREEGGTFRIRVSDTLWHREWRKGWLKNKSVKNRVRELFSDDGSFDNPFYSATSTCNECGHIQNGYYEEEPCEVCQTGNYEASETDVYFPKSDPNGGWIYADTWDNKERVIPSHPERGQFGWNDHGERNGPGSGCGTHMIVTFKPDGSHLDGCCRGSNLPFGSVADHPLVLLGINNTFLAQERPSCRECHFRAKEWEGGATHLAARAYYEQLVTTLESGDFTFLAEESEDGEERDFVGFCWTDPLTGKDERLEVENDPR